jgi:hypothetical protein
MELVSAYIYNTSPVEATNIDERDTIWALKQREWYEDGRIPEKFKILNKRFKIGEEWYRAVLRFKRNEGIFKDVLELDTPIPFMIVKSEIVGTVTTSEGISVRFKDIKSWHGRDVKSTVGYFKAGVPSAVINAVFEDIKACVVYRGYKNTYTIPAPGVYSKLDATSLITNIEVIRIDLD